MNRMEEEHFKRHAGYSPEQLSETAPPDEETESEGGDHD